MRPILFAKKYCPIDRIAATVCPEWLSAVRREPSDRLRHSLLREVVMSPSPPILWSASCQLSLSCRQPTSLDQNLCCRNKLSLVAAPR